ncbi:hypothetical protein KCP73_07795 [Salmonella enterica subsp. enterica]|nr:hypothetical protein KCP73_07795 [Salmonella enterica subsp. enterica]
MAKSGEKCRTLLTRRVTSDGVRAVMFPVCVSVEAAGFRGKSITDTPSPTNEINANQHDVINTVTSNKIGNAGGDNGSDAA